MQKVIMTGRAIIVENEKILLVSKNKDFWVVPGGMADNNENIIECLKRELYEELGISIEPLNLFYVSELEDGRFKNKKIELFFKCKIVKGLLNEKWQDPDGMVKFAQFFSLNDLKNIKHFPEFLKDGEWLKEISEEIYKGVFYR